MVRVNASRRTLVTMSMQCERCSRVMDILRRGGGGRGGGGGGGRGGGGESSSSGIGFRFWLASKSAAEEAVQSEQCHSSA